MHKYFHYVHGIFLQNNFIYVDETLIGCDKVSPLKERVNRVNE